MIAYRIPSCYWNYKQLYKLQVINCWHNITHVSVSSILLHSNSVFCSKITLKIDANLQRFIKKKRVLTDFYYKKFQVLKFFLQTFIEFLIKSFLLKLLKIHFTITLSRTARKKKYIFYSTWRVEKLMVFLYAAYLAPVRILYQIRGYLEIFKYWMHSHIENFSMWIH